MKKYRRRICEGSAGLKNKHTHPPREVRGRAGTWEHGLAPKERRLLARAVPFHSAWSECRQRGAARARRKRTCWASSPERASAEARKRATRASQPRAVRGRAGTWEHGLAPKERRPLARAVPFHACMERVSPARRGARASEAHVLGLVPRESERRDAQARYTRKPPRAVRGQGWHVGAGAWRRRNGGLSLVQCPSIAYGPSVASAARRARVGSARAGPRPQRERARSESASALHAQATTRNEREGWHVGAGAWRRRNGGLSLVQCPSMAYGPSVASAARRARGGSARAGPRPQRERARSERASALHAQATTRNEREGWHVGAGAWRRRNGGLSLVQCPSIAYGPSVASAARRARGGSARAGPRPQRERASAGERKRATRASHHAQ